MLAVERRNLILATLEAEKRVLVPELAKKYAVTEETIRRDLEKLEKEGLLKKTYGGAVKAHNLSSEMPYKMRAETNKAQKLIIAEKIHKLITPKENIILDASSTCVHIARRIKSVDNITIITNSVEILMECSSSSTNINTISTGGVLRGSSLSLVGSGTTYVLNQLTADKAIISCKGLDFEKGVMESNLEEAEIKRVMAANAQEVILAVDSSKFDRMSFAKTLDLLQIHTVVSDNIPTEWAKFFDETNIRYL
ncbi:MAG: DeoR/GlpR family DNA-binding transcription regulator [Defluviitaleaceae bacterium]|nr:DeoR/GlpR family DNA-binding transcription regulator [Defluviitaleaceae bacterium]